MKVDNAVIHFMFEAFWVNFATFKCSSANVQVQQKESEHLCCSRGSCSLSWHLHVQVVPQAAKVTEELL